MLIPIEFLIKLFVFIKNIFKNHTDLCETRTDLASLSIMFLLGAGFSVYQSHIEKNVEHHSEAITQSPCEKKFKYHCLNGGCYYLVDENILCFDVTYGMENKVVNSTCGETQLEFHKRWDHFEPCSKHLWTFLSTIVRIIGLEFTFKKLKI